MELTEAVGLVACIWKAFDAYFYRNTIVTKAGFVCLSSSTTIQG